MTGMYRARSCIVLKKVQILPYSAPRIMHNQTDKDPVGNGDQTSCCQRSLGLIADERAERGHVRQRYRKLSQAAERASGDSNRGSQLWHDGDLGDAGSSPKRRTGDGDEQ